jgi:type II secretory ATPase GspE/PulE/Tfp pilus assembly ATPase PilB-like protein
MEKTKIPILDKNNFQYDPLIASLLPIDSAKRLRAFPLFKIGKKLVMALTEPKNLEKIDELTKITGYEISPVFVKDNEFIELINEVYRAIEFNDESFKKRLSSSSAIEVLDGLLEEAVSKKASDIHIELVNGKVQIRFRIDGEMIISGAYPITIHDEVISRIKLICGLDIAEKRLPLEGKVVKEINGTPIDLRIVTLPTIR